MPPNLLGRGRGLLNKLRGEGQGPPRAAAQPWTGLWMGPGEKPGPRVPAPAGGARLPRFLLRLQRLAPARLRKVRRKGACRSVEGPDEQETGLHGQRGATARPGLRSTRGDQGTLGGHRANRQETLCLQATGTRRVAEGGRTWLAAAPLELRARRGGVWARSCAWKAWRSRLRGGSTPTPRTCDPSTLCPAATTLGPRWVQACEHCPRGPSPPTADAPTGWPPQVGGQDAPTATNPPLTPHSLPRRGDR